MKSKPVNHGNVQGARFNTEAFRTWLDMQNYDPTTVRYGPVRVGEFYEWLGHREANGDEVEHFFEYLRERKNKRTGGGLAVATMRTYVRMLRLYSRYLRDRSQDTFDVAITLGEAGIPDMEIFTRAEISKLYRATDGSLLGMRDRAMLALYYGCGLRRNEGVCVQIKDIFPDRNLLHVRRGKNYKERYVPMVGDVRKDILDYVHYARPALLVREAEQALLIGIRGSAVSGNQMYARFQRLIEKANINKRLGLHALRHSIATHLLASGMSLYQIRRFLGHSSLESTQIYTHLTDGMFRTGSSGSKGGSGE